MAIRLSNIKVNGDLYKSSYSGEVEGKLDWSVLKKKMKRKEIRDEEYRQLLQRIDCKESGGKEY